MEKHIQPQTYSGQEYYPAIGALRVSACLLIYFHHYLKVTKSICSFSFSAIIAISFFMLIAGFLIPINSKYIIYPHKWFVDQILKIYTTWWIVFISLFSVNFLLKSAEVSVLSFTIDIIGGTLFNERPLYDAPWFISIILLLYLFSYISRIFSKNDIVNVLILFFLVGIFSEIISRIQMRGYVTRGRLMIWFFCFHFGYCYSLLYKHKLIDFFQNKIKLAMPTIPRELCKLLRDVELITYPFYLVHGPILHLLFNTLKADKEITFSLGLCCSTLLSIYVNRYALYFTKKIRYYVISSV